MNPRDQHRRAGGRTIGLAILVTGVLLAGCGARTASPSPAITASPSGTATPIAAATPPPLATPVPTQEAQVSLPPVSCPQPMVHVVKAGDTLWGIAERYGVTVDSLLAANPQIADRRAIRVGDEITISPIDLGTLGGDSSQATAINNGGQVVGMSGNPAGLEHAFLWQDGKMTDLGTLGGGSSHAAAVNDGGQVVGSSATATNVQHAFLWENGSMIDLGTLGGGNSEAVAINDLGQVVGWSEMAANADEPPPRHAFLWRAGTMIDLGTLGGGSSEASAINERGQIVGTSSTASGGRHAFRWEAGTMTDLRPPGDGYGGAVAINDRGQVAFIGPGGTVVAINDRGQIVGGRSLSDVESSGDIFLWQDGTTTDLGPLESAFSWQDGTMSSLGSLGQGATTPSAVNGRGQVVGSSLTDFPDPIEWEWCCSTFFHAFVWQDSSIVDLGDLGGVGTRTSSEAADINDCGQVVGSSAIGPSRDDPRHAALWYAASK